MNRKLEEILNKYGISQQNVDGSRRTISQFIDDIYLRLSPHELLELMNEVEKNSLELFGGHNV